MKNKLTIAAALMLLAFGTAEAQKKETRTVGTFTKLSFRTPGKCYLRQGSPQKVEIEGSDEVLSKITTEVTGGKLSIGTDKKWNNWNWRGESVKVYVTVANIDAVSVSGSGDLVAETKLTGGDFKIDVSGSGSMVAEIDATGDLSADVSGSGNLEVKGKCSNFESDISGSGDVKAEEVISNNASFDLSGSGKVVASGSAKNVKASITGSGEVRAANLDAESCEVRISGSGDVQISVKNSLDASISGSGSVSYKGNPAHVNSHSAGSGSIHKM